MITITLPYTRPPLTPNQRMHWAQKARITRQIRETACALARLSKVGAQPPSRVKAVWFPPDRRARDAGSLTLTVKAAIDGLVDAGVWPDDNTRWVVSETYEIGDVDRTNPRIELHLEENR